jgi:hypothetical protein
MAPDQTNESPNNVEPMQEPLATRKPERWDQMEEVFHTD